MSNKQLLWFK